MIFSAADGETRRPVGVCFVHQYYPGFIDVIPESRFLVDAPDLKGGVEIIGHVRPLVMTDFGNGLVQKKVKKGELTQFSRPVRQIDINSISMEGTGHEGRKGPVYAVEKAKRGRIFYQGLYTELQTLTEIYEPSENGALSAHSKLVDRLVGTYRYLKPDPRLEMASELPADTTPLRVGYYLYSEAEQAMPFLERFSRAEPDRLQMSMMSYRTAGRALQDHETGTLEKRTEQLAAWLQSGFVLPDNLAEIERLADLAFSQNSYRPAIVEAISILEAGILAARARAIAEGTAPWAKDQDIDALPLRFIFEKILPLLLKNFDGDVGAIVAEAKAARLVRNQVVHHGHQPSLDETKMVLGTARNILSILELPERYKGNYKSKPSAP